MSVPFLDGDVADGSVDLQDQPGARTVGVVAALPGRDAAAVVGALVEVSQRHVRPDVDRHGPRQQHGDVAGRYVHGNHDVGGQRRCQVHSGEVNSSASA